MVDLIHKAAEVEIARPAADKRAEKGIEVLKEMYEVLDNFIYARYVDATGRSCRIRGHLKVPRHDSQILQLNDADFQAAKKAARKQVLPVLNQRPDLFK